MLPRADIRCDECGDGIPTPVARPGGAFVCARCWEPVCYGVGGSEDGMEEQSLIDTAAEQVENDPRISIILIMRRARPQRTWREIGRKLGMSTSGVLKLYRRATV